MWRTKSGNNINTQKFGSTLMREDMTTILRKAVLYRGGQLFYTIASCPSLSRRLRRG